MVSACLPSDALSQHLLSYLGFSYLGCGVSLHSCSSKAQLLLLTLDEITPPNTEHGVTPLGPPTPVQPLLLGRGVAHLGRHPLPWVWGISSRRVAQSCPTFCHPMDYSTPGLPVFHYPRVCSNSYPLSWWCHPVVSSSFIPFSSCPQSFPSSESFSIYLPVSVEELDPKFTECLI